jgi:hypothetical protein
MTEEKESAHGKLSAVDQTWNGPRFLALIVITLSAALTILFLAASYRNPGPWDFAYHPLAHDPIKHSLQSSTMGR